MSSAKQSFELPTYEQDRLLNGDDPAVASSSVAQPEGLPAEDASPEDVRAYLFAVLIHTNGLPHGEARQISSKWTLGTGRELRKYPPPMFREIFGGEAGWALYMAVRSEIEQEYLRKNPVSKIRLYVAIPAAIIVAFNTILYFALSEEDKALSYISIFFSSFILLLLIVLIITVGPQRQKAADAAEAHLLSSYRIEASH